MVFLDQLLFFVFSQKKLLLVVFEDIFGFLKQFLLFVFFAFSVLDGGLRIHPLHGFLTFGGGVLAGAISHPLLYF